MLDFIIEPGNDTLVLIIFLLMCDLHLIDSILQFLFGIMDLSILLAADVEQFIIFLLDNSFQVESQPLCLLLEPLLLTFRILGHDLALVRFIICDLLQLADLSFNLLFILLAADLQIGDFFLFLVAFNEQFAIRITHKKDHPFQSSYFLLQKLQVVKILQLSVGSRGESRLVGHDVFPVHVILSGILVYFGGWDLGGVFFVMADVDIGEAEIFVEIEGVVAEGGAGKIVSNCRHNNYIINKT